MDGDEMSFRRLENVKERRCGSVVSKTFVGISEPERYQFIAI